ncbi:MFS transporter [Spirochaeta africana]|nr:MFS transporter [Spirochaeta africana]
MTKRLPLRIRIGYGFGDLPGNLFFTMMGFYLLNYLTDTVLLGPALAGTAIMVGRIWDAITDPAVGYLSDHTYTRFGRRRPYMLVGAVTLGFSMAALFWPPPGDSVGSIFWYIVIVYCVVNTAYTLHNIPYGAWSPEITQDYHERTTLNAFRNLFAVTGTLVGAGLILPLISAMGGGVRGWQGMGAVVGLFMLVTGLIPVLLVPEKKHVRGAHHPPQLLTMLKDYLGAMRNRPYLLILIPWSLNIAGINIIQASLIYYFTYIYRSPDAFVIALGGMLLVCMLSIPFWVAVSRRIGKKYSYITGMGFFAAMILLFFIGAPHMDVRFAYIVMALAGIGFGTQYVMPFAIVADVTDVDFAASGVRREGVFFGMFTFWSKIGQAIGIWLVGLMLELVGFVQPEIAGVAPLQSEQTITGIRWLVGPVPVLFFLGGIVILWFYPISKARFDAVMREIQELD